MAAADLLATSQPGGTDILPARDDEGWHDTNAGVLGSGPLSRRTGRRAVYSGLLSTSWGPASTAVTYWGLCRIVTLVIWVTI